MPNDKKGQGGTYTPETAYLGTDGGPASAPAKADRPAVKQAKLVGEVAGSMPYNDTKPSEYDPAGAPPAGSVSPQFNDLAAASTPSEMNSNAKTGGAGPVKDGEYQDGSLDKDRAPPPEGPLTTNQGVLIADNQSSLKAGVRGPALLKDFIREDHPLDHERIPSASCMPLRGHGFRMLRQPEHLTCRLPSPKGKQTPVFTILHRGRERGSGH